MEFSFDETTTHEVVGSNLRVTAVLLVNQNLSSSDTKMLQ
jgi:hypothetical protein